MSSPMWTSRPASRTPPSRCSEKLAEDGRKEPGSERFEAWQQNNRTNHFTVVEIWKNREAADAHAVTASTKEFREKLGPMIGALFDDRFYTSME